ncbi:MAG: hypothetical protein ACOCQQ_01920 [Candidatus Nanoarchaeia archaeon]
MTQKTYVQKLEELETKRQKAFHKGNESSYAYLCDLLGMTPEDNIKYQQGLFELSQQPRLKSTYENYINRFLYNQPQTTSQNNKKTTVEVNIKKTVENDYIQKFIDAAKKYLNSIPADILNRSDFEKNKTYKEGKQLLQAFFPKRFGPKGSQDLDKVDTQNQKVYADFKIPNKVKHVLETYLKK